MLVIIGERIPKRVRGILQIWLIEVKPNIFIGDVNKVIETRITKFVESYLNVNTDIMIVRNGNSSQLQGIDIKYCFNSNNKLVNIHGLNLIQKKANKS